MNSRSPCSQGRSQRPGVRMLLRTLLFPPDAHVQAGSPAARPLCRVVPAQVLTQSWQTPNVSLFPSTRLIPFREHGSRVLQRKPISQTALGNLSYLFSGIFFSCLKPPLHKSLGWGCGQKPPCSLVPCPVPPVHQLSSWVRLCQSIQILPPTHLQWLITEGSRRGLCSGAVFSQTNWSNLYEEQLKRGFSQVSTHTWLCEVENPWLQDSRLLLQRCFAFKSTYVSGVVSWPSRSPFQRVSWQSKDSILLIKCQKSEVKWSYHFSSVWESSPHSLNTFICHVIAVTGPIGLEPKSWPNSEGVRNPHFSVRHEKLESFNPHRKINDEKNSSIRRNDVINSKALLN